jgi:hypothetical protein
MPLRQWFASRRDLFASIYSLERQVCAAERDAQDATETLVRVQRLNEDLRGMLDARDAYVLRLQKKVEVWDTIILARDQRIAELLVERKEQARDRASGRYVRAA